MRRAFHTLDVFTTERFAGNPLAVVLDAQGLDGAAMQRIAREFNLAETVFVLEPRDPVNTARLRIFTPTRELPFAGHPTVGAAALIAQLRAPEMLRSGGLRIALEEEVGLVGCDVRLGAAPGAVYATFGLPRLPERAGEAPDAARLAEGLGLDPGDIGFGAHAPSRFSAGTPFTFVPLASPAAIVKAKPREDLFAGDPPPAYFLYVRECETPGAAFHARMFASGWGVAEDPATGSAVAAFAGVLAECGGLGDGAHSFDVEQGFEMGRPSLISLGMAMERGRLVEASIGGAAVRVAEGFIEA
ncbi:MAG: PhzF family phenazine biosynthesis protein [Hyphomicrobiales bacterium]|nr:PhzF family phenazine biosynthesis protein [Hyphomicrobiales bacterium]